MASVSAQFSVTVRVELDARSEPLGKLTAAIAETGGALQGVDLVPGAGAEGKRVREFTIDARDQAHWEQILRAIGSTRGARVLDYVDRTLAMHRGGKIEQHNKHPLKTRDDLSMAYTPGVARVCMEIAADRNKAFEFTIKKNTVAVVSDGSAVLGLGDIGPEAAMPVMEGKAMLFKEFADIDAFPICLEHPRPREDHRGRAADGADLRRHQPRGHLGASLLRDRGARSRRRSTSRSSTTTSTEPRW